MGIQISINSQISYIPKSENIKHKKQRDENTKQYFNPNLAQLIK